MYIVGEIIVSEILDSNSTPVVSTSFITNLLSVNATVIDKELYALRRPGELGHPRSDLLVQALDPLFKQRPLFRLKAGHDSVVVPDNEKDVFPQHSQLFALLVDLGGIVWHLKSQPLPVVHLTKQLEQCVAEAHFYQASPAWGTRTTN